MGSFSSEEAAELVATIRGEHVVMKQWFNEDPSEEAAALREKYGKYPGLWKEVLNWVGWKEARKTYLKYTQQREAGTARGTANGNANENEENENENGTANGNPNTNPNTNPNNFATSQTPGDKPAPRKRRSRWGNAGNDGAATSTSTNNNNNNNNTANKRRSRWGREDPSNSATANANPNATATVGGHYGPSSSALPRSLPGLGLGLGLPGMPTNLKPEQKTEMLRLQGRLREINTKLDNLEAEAARVDALPRGHRERSPSPPPIYGADGKRKNTRSVRWRQKYTSERHDVLEQLMGLNPATRQSCLFKRKRTKKIRIPIEEHPQYNFIGLIIGPRGKTQKELEKKTGCKIAIRGRGSVKEGARGRRDGKVTESDDEPLHVVITGDDQRSVDAATDMIEQMLVVIDDEKNVHKQRQLRELALLNGTLKEENEYCPICGEKGHRAFECPKRFANNNNNHGNNNNNHHNGNGNNNGGGLAIRCAFCGDSGHPTRDCPLKRSSGEARTTAETKEMDSDYVSFMAELDGKPVEASRSQSQPAPTTATTTALAHKPDAALPPMTTTTTTNSYLPPPPPPPPPSQATNAGMLPPPPPPQGASTNLPPPPPPPPMPNNNNNKGLPPPPPGGPNGMLGPPGSHNQHHHHPYGSNNNNNRPYRHGQQQQHYHNHNNSNSNNNHYRGGGSAPPQGGNYYSHGGGGSGQHQGQQPQPQQNQQQDQNQQTWDYTAYYGQGSETGGGAGGFNWWES